MTEGNRIDTTAFAAAGSSRMVRWRQIFAVTRRNVYKPAGGMEGNATGGPVDTEAQQQCDGCGRPRLTHELFPLADGSIHVCTACYTTAASMLLTPDDAHRRHNQS